MEKDLKQRESPSHLGSMLVKENRERELIIRGG